VGRAGLERKELRERDKAFRRDKDEYVRWGKFQKKNPKKNMGRKGEQILP